MMDKEVTNSGDILDLQVLKRLFIFVKPYQGKFIFLVFLTIATAIAAPVVPYLVGYTIDHYVLNKDFHGLVKFTMVLIGVLFLQGFIQYLQTFFSGWLGQNIIRDIRIKLYQHLLSLRSKFFDKTPIGRLVTRTISDLETLSDIFSQGVAAIIGDMLQILVILAFMLYEDWKLTVVSLSTLPLLLISTYVFKEKIKVAFNDVRNAVSNLNSYVQEHITGMSIVQIFSSEHIESEKFKEINNEHKHAHLKSVWYYSIYFPVAEIINATGVGLLVWYGAKGVLHSEVTIGVLVTFIMYINMFFRPIRQIADRFNTLQMGIVSSSRVLKLMDNKEQIPNTGTFRPERLSGKVNFKNVWFAYNDEDYVLKNINFEVEAGKTIALVGATGAGKSSVINLLSRFYDINKGQICIDDTDIKEFDLDVLRKHIGVVLQDVFLFSDTIANNISLKNDKISRKKMVEAAELVGALKFIERLPGGFDYNVMERGATLSVGQRQLISFVRAMVYDPEIIILDEATSSVDTETEELIQNAIETLMKGRTSIVIAHRLSTIQNADRILVLDHGEIKERGTHAELLAHNGFYSQLYKMQYKEVV